MFGKKTIDFIGVKPGMGQNVSDILLTYSDAHRG